jgi:hypothetical protein
MALNSRWEANLAELEPCTHRRRTRCPAPGLVSDVATRLVYCRMHSPYHRASRSENQKVKQAFRQMLRTSFGIG